MKSSEPSLKILDRQSLRERCANWNSEGKKIVTTNGAFDLLHTGHIASIRAASQHGDVLVVGMNSDASVKRYKGETRPFQDEKERALHLACLPWVDAVHIFDEDTADRFIRDVKPIIHCKGNQFSAIAEDQTLREIGARTEYTPFIQGTSTTTLSEKIISEKLRELGPQMSSAISAHLAFLATPSAERFKAATEAVKNALLAKKTLFFCGNGGSAATAQHFAAEYVGRYKLERQGYPAIALTTDTSTITAIANDYGYEEIFARQLDALGAPGDVLIVMSTSGKSKNIVRALEVAREKNIATISFVGESEGPVCKLADYGMVIPSKDTPRVQEVTDFLLHNMCEHVELELCKKS